MPALGEGAPSDSGNVEGSLCSGGKLWGKTGAASLQASSLVCFLGLFPSAPQSREGAREPKDRLGPVRLELSPGVVRALGRAGPRGQHDSGFWYLPDSIAILHQYK